MQAPTQLCDRLGGRVTCLQAGLPSLRSTRPAELSAIAEVEEEVEALIFSECILLASVQRLRPGAWARHRHREGKSEDMDGTNCNCADGDVNRLVDRRGPRLRGEGRRLALDGHRGHIALYMYMCMHALRRLFPNISVRPPTERKIALA